MIGYLTNNSGMKNGAANRNSVNRWFDEEPLTYMEMDSDGLGIQMDADHDVEEAATMTEFSQVISALETNRDVLKLSSFFKIIEENGEKYVFFGYDFSSQRDAVESLPISESLVKTRKDGTLFFGDMYPISTGDDVAEALK